MSSIRKKRNQILYFSIELRKLLWFLRQKNDLNISKSCSEIIRIKSDFLQKLKNEITSFNYSNIE